MRRRHGTEIAWDRDGWYWACATCGAAAEDAYSDEGDAIDAADRHERDPFPSH